MIGSTELVRTLMEADVVDEFRVMIDPIVVGGGKRIFRDDGALRPLRLVHSQATTTGAIIATYAPADDRASYQDSTTLLPRRPDSKSPPGQPG